MNKKVHKAELCLNYNDHRDINKKLNLFSFHEEGPGFPFFLASGVAMKNALVEYWRRKHRLNGYQEIESPIMLNKELWERSGHWKLFRENMYVSEVDKGDFAIKPMNCPGSMLVYKEKKRSFKELPLRICEMGKVHRNENSGSLHGLLRVRSFSVDDAHIFCSGEQLKSEIKGVLKLCLEVLNHCGFNNYEFELSVRSEEKKEKYLGLDSDWELAESVLQQSLEEMGFNSIRMEGEAKFYGPAIDIKIFDSEGRSWQCSSIQMDFNLGKRFDLKYYDSEGRKQVPYILHRCIFGSLERFMAMLLEHHKGKLPLWLAPVQVKVVSANGDISGYANLIIEKLEDSRIRYEYDLSDNSLSKKMKCAISDMIPVVVVVGKKEQQYGKVSVRYLSGEKESLVDIKELLDKF